MVLCNPTIIQMKNYRELIIWRKGIEIVKAVYQLTKQFLTEEKYGIVTQVSRAAVSIPANIAEGSSRSSDKDYARFLQISLGSAFEVQTYLIIAKDMGGVSRVRLTQLKCCLKKKLRCCMGFFENCRKILFNLIKATAKS